MATFDAGSLDGKELVYRTTVRGPVVDPSSGQIVNWNNKPATGFGAADDNWTYGDTHRVQLLNTGISPKPKLSPAGVVSAMNEAATHDLRQRLVSLLAQVMTQAPAP